MGCSVNEEILVNATRQRNRVAVLDAGQVQELLSERTASRGLSATSTWAR
jgi:Ribonuclease G/E